MSPRISYSFYPHREVSLDLTDEIVKELVVSVTKDERPVAERGFDWIAVRGYHADDEFDWDSGTISFFKNAHERRTMGGLDKRVAIPTDECQLVTGRNPR